MSPLGEDRFLDIVMSNPSVEAVLARAARMGLSDWYLTAGCLFQTIWNVLDGHPPTRGSATTTSSTSMVMT